jgi:hypothetical protein
MQNILFNKTIDFIVYNQVIKGQFNPTKASKTVSKSALQLVTAANTCIVYSASTKKEANSFLDSFDLTSLGYKSGADLEILNTNDSDPEIFRVIIKPQSIYSLSEDLSLPDPPEEKSKKYLDFFIDEFERIKIRAEKNMHTALSKDDIQFYAFRNLQLLHKLNDDSRNLFNLMYSSSGYQFQQSDIFILYILNLFIIRCIIFYGKLFKPFLNENLPYESELRKKFHDQIPHIYKYPWILFQPPPVNEKFNNHNSQSQLNNFTQEYQKVSLSEESEIHDNLIKEASEIYDLKGSIQLNCKSNVFLAEIFKMIHDNRYNGNSMISVEHKKLIKLISYYAKDIEGNLLNPSTVNSVIKPSNSKKRPGKL